MSVIPFIIRKAESDLDRARYNFRDHINSCPIALDKTEGIRDFCSLCHTAKEELRMLRSLLKGLKLVQSCNEAN